MFSGIIQTISVVKRVQKKRGGKELVIATKLRRRFDVGESVMISGICSTVTARRGEEVTVFYMPETLKKTTAAEWRVGTRVHIEPSLKVGDTLSGHFVFGHVDGCARIERIEPVGASKLFWFRVPKNLARYLVPKGSVALDGTSLTVVQVKGNRFSVSMIPFTLRQTTFGSKHVGDEVNFEADMLAKYLARLLRK